MIHKIVLKTWVNTPLRFIQGPFTDRPWLLASVLDKGQFVRYKFCRVQIERW